jgi:hypothetical protein
MKEQEGNILNMIKALGEQERKETVERVRKIQEATSSIIEKKNGFPVISRKVFDDCCSIKSEDLINDKGTATFNFQGYVSADEYCPETFVDTQVTRGILKDENQRGVSVITDGTLINKNGEAAGYTFSIGFSDELAKKFNIFCTRKNCFEAGEYKERFGVDDEEILRLKNSGFARSFDIRLLNQKNDPLKRKKAEYIHEKIVEYINEGKPLHRIAEYVKALEVVVNGFNEENLSKKLSIE